MAHRIGDGWDEWTEPENLGSVINTSYEETFVSIDPSFDYLYYDSYPSGAQNRNIWRATLSDEIKDKIIKARDKDKQNNKPQQLEEELIQEPQPEESIAENNKEDEKTEMTNNVENDPSNEEETLIAVNTQPQAITIDKEMDYVKEQQRNNQGFLSQIGEKLGLGGKEEDFQLIDAGVKGQKLIEIFILNLTQINCKENLTLF